LQVSDHLQQKTNNSAARRSRRALAALRYRKSRHDLTANVLLAWRQHVTGTLRNRSSRNE